MIKQFSIVKSLNILLKLIKLVVLTILVIGCEKGVSAQSRNRDNSRIVLDKVGILTLSDRVGIPTWHSSIPTLSLRKVGIGTILELSWTK